MNKDLTNLILSYFTIDFNNFINHIKIANPILALLDLHDDAEIDNKLVY